MAASLVDGIAREGRAILGGDLSFILSLREATAPEQAFLAAQGRVSAAATMRAMARSADGRTALVEIKAVDTAYPLTGAVLLDPAGPLAAALALRDGAYGAAADPALLARLDLKPGARITVGAASFEIRAPLPSPTSLRAAPISRGCSSASRALRATDLLQPGSLRWHYRLRLLTAMRPCRAQAVTAEPIIACPKPAKRSAITNASPALEQNVERFTQYLTLGRPHRAVVGRRGRQRSRATLTQARRNRHHEALGATAAGCSRSI